MCPFAVERQLAAGPTRAVLIQVETAALPPGMVSLEKKQAEKGAAFGVPWTSPWLIDLVSFTGWSPLERLITSTFY